MTFFLIGLGLFFGGHLVFPRLSGTLGELPVKGLVALSGFAGLALIWTGYSAASIEPLYEPLGYETGRAVAHALMPVAALLAIAGNFPSNVKRVIAHPMSTGVLLWALVHLAINGETRAVILFGAFAAYALYDIVTAKPRAARPEPRPMLWDGALIVLAVLVYGALLWAHGAIGGVAVIGG